MTTTQHEHDEADQSRSKGIYLLPNFFTTSGLFAGFYAIVAAMKGYFDLAAVATFIAMLADSLDGRVARLTNTQSAFGAEYDSLSDMIAFGVAPALLAYSWGLYGLGKLGWLAAFFYTAATGLRLARFNVKVSEPDTDKRYFQGLPCPAAAGFLTGLIWVFNIYHLQGDAISIVVGLVTVFAGILMVSNLRYRSFKDIDLKGKVPFITILILILFFVGIALDPPEVLFGLFCLYALSAPILALRRVKKRKKQIDKN